MTKEIVTEFIFLGNESVHSENTLYSIPFGNKVGCIYLDFYKMHNEIFVEKAQEPSPLIML